MIDFSGLKLYFKLPFVLAAYYLLAKLGAALYSSADGVPYFWPANSLLVAALCFSVRRQWAALILGVALTELLLDVGMDMPWLASSGIAIANALESVLAAYLLRTFVGDPPRLQHWKQLWRFVVLIVIACPAASAFLGAAALTGAGIAPSYVHAWYAWWVGDALGLLLVLPALLTLPRLAALFHRRLSGVRMLEAMFIVGAGPVMMFYDRANVPDAAELQSYFLLPFVVWLALRFHPAATAWANLAIACGSVQIHGLGQGAGPFSAVSTELHTFAIQTSLFVIALTAAALAALVAERRHALLQWQRSAEELAAAHAEVQQDRMLLAERVAERTAELTETIGNLARAKLAASAANDAKSQFLATMSHELRTPMNGVIGTLELLRESGLSANQGELVSVINDSAVNLLRILDDILDFSKIEAEKLELENAPLSLTRVVEAVCDSMLAHARRKNIVLTTFTDPELPATIVGDQLRLGQMLTNLLSNAIKFSSCPGRLGRVAVRAECLTDAAGEPFLHLSVSDNGIGIAPDVQDRLFSVFTQVDSSTTRRFGGTGLGLSICQRLAALMDGRVELASAPGKGSTFTIKLPLKGRIGNPAPLRYDNLSGLRCLVVTADAALGQDWCAYLAHAGAQPEWVANGKAATVAAHASAIDIVVYTQDQEAQALREALSVASRGGEQIGWVAIRSGRRRQPRRDGDGAISQDGDAMHIQQFLRAVAIAAGHAFATEDDQQPAPTGILRASAPLAEAVPLSQGTILVAEDNEVNRKVISWQLSLLGYRAELCADGRSALAAWRRGRHALILTDLHMPELDGCALTAAIRSEEQGSRTPIIAFTANALKGEAVRHITGGMDDYLTKPVRLRSLQEMLQKWLQPCSSPHEAPKQTDAPLISGASAIEIDVLRRQIGDDAALIEELLHEYRRALVVDVDRMRRACDARDWQQVGALAHRLKSSSRAVGAVRLGNHCQDLEHAGKSGNDAAVAQLWPVFESMLANVLEELRAELGAAVEGYGVMQPRLVIAKGHSEVDKD